MAEGLTLAHLRRYAVARTLSATTLTRAVRRLGFVQADPIRAPARAQDLILRHRVADYRAGDLERRYPRLPLDEDYLINYGFMPREVSALLHPRGERRPWDEATWQAAHAVRAAAEAQGEVLPRDLAEAHLPGPTVNAWGGTSRAITVQMEEMHRRGMLRVRRRVGGQRAYVAASTAPPVDPDTRADALVDVVVNLYAPLTHAGLGRLVGMLRRGVPALAADGALDRAHVRARERLGGGTVDGVVWRWPAGEDPRARRGRRDTRVRLLAPFDPIVWDRDRFEALWGWRYRFEAYVPAAQRTMGYYTLPVLWGDHIIGWAQASRYGPTVDVTIGFPSEHPTPPAPFWAALDEERQRLAAFLSTPA